MSLWRRALPVSLLSLALACSAQQDSGGNPSPGAGGGTVAAGGSGGGALPGGNVGTGGATVVLGGAGPGGGTSAEGGAPIVVTQGGSTSAGSAGAGAQRDPRTCEEAVANRTYLGCEYFPTVLGNVVSPEFDYTVIVANPTDEAADLAVEGPGGFQLASSVAAHSLTPLYLPWVPELKGPNLSSSCSSDPFSESVLAVGGAYRLTSTRPVAAYQFSPLQFRATGGPPGKAWSCEAGVSPACECNSYTNDASLLLPTNALTNSYVAFTWRDQGNPARSKPSYIAITATQDATDVAIQMGPTGQILAGPAGSGLVAAGPGEIIGITLNRGDVAELIAVAGTDLSGTQVQSPMDKPIQVMSGSPSATVPNDDVRASDHLEEIVFPAESVGKNYVVTVPTGPGGAPISHIVRLYGLVLPTVLSYFPAAPAGAPTTLAPGAVTELEVTSDFQVQGTEPFAVGSFLVGGQLLDPGAPADNSAGDPSQSLATTIQQYRDKYVFVAPVDYEGSFADIVAPSGTRVTLDGVDLDPSTAQSLLGRSDDDLVDQVFDIYRAHLDGGIGGGVHELLASVPVGLQVVGYGRFTSYQFPGGLNLKLISDPPPVIEVPK